MTETTSLPQAPLLDERIPRFQRNDWLVVSAISILQIGMNAYSMVRYPLWVDEAYSAVMAAKPIGEIHAAMVYDAGPPLYYDLLHVWQMVFGLSDISLRGMSLLFSLLATFLLYRLCLQYGNRSAAWLAALLWAVFPISIYYASEARNYTLFAALLLGTIVWMVEYFRTNKKRHLLFSTLCWIGMLYTHNLAWFLYPGLVVFALVLSDSRKRALSIAVAFFVGSFCILLWLPTILAQMSHTERTIAWVAKAWTPYSIALTFSTFVPGGANMPFIDLKAFRVSYQIVFGCLIYGAMIFGLVAAIRKRCRFLLAVLTLFAVGILLPYLFSLLYRPICLAGRTDFHLFPLFIVLLAFGLQQIPRPLLRYTMIGVITLAAVSSYVVEMQRNDGLNETDVLRMIERHYPDGGVILTTGLTRPFLQHYLRDGKYLLLSYPQDMEHHLAHLNEEWYFQHADLEADARQVIQQAIENIKSGSNLIVIESDRAINRTLFQQLRSHPNLKSIEQWTTPKMGLRRLNEPLYIERFQYESNE